MEVTEGWIVHDIDDDTHTDMQRLHFFLNLRGFDEISE